MRSPVFRALSVRGAAGRALIAATVVLSAASGCSGRSELGGRHAGSAPRPLGSISGSPSGMAEAGSALSRTGLHAVRPCPGISAFSCGTLSVRLDPFGSAPGRLSLQVAVSDVAAAPHGVLLLLTGGPGQPGDPFVSRVAGRLGPALRGYRLVMLDQRGTGAGALRCPALQQEMGASDLTVPTPAAVRSCGTAIGPRRQYFATADTVADIPDRACPAPAGTHQRQNEQTCATSGPGSACGLAAVPCPAAERLLAGCLPGRSSGGSYVIACRIRGYPIRR